MPDGIDRKRLFTGCVLALVATAFGFAVRAAILGQWRAEFNLSQEQIGYLLIAGLMLSVVFLGGLSLAAQSREAKAYAQMKRDADRWVYRMAA